MNIKVENVQLQYGDHFALHDVNFELNGNKIYGLLGKNGAGKTSLLSLLASFRKPTSGVITINGEEPFENPTIMKQVAFLYDKDYQDESDNIVEMLKDIQSYRPNFDMDYAEELIDLFKIDRTKQIKKYSKGMKSSLNVIIGLASRAPITLLDEVYLGMDAHLREYFYEELLEEQQRHPRIFILSTHLVSEMDYLFDEILIIDEGKMLIHEEYDTFISKGSTITGNIELVDQFVRSKKQINAKQLAGTKAVMIYGALTPDEQATAIDLGLEITPVTLHELFVHLTKEETTHESK